MTHHVLHSTLDMPFPHCLGEYWIDPNGGHPSDAFKVHCDYSDRCETCIPMQDKVRVQCPCHVACTPKLLVILAGYEAS